MHKERRSPWEDERLLKKHILPAFGKRLITSIKQSDVVRLHASLKEKRYLGNRIIALFSAMSNLSNEWGITPSDFQNPCKHVKKFKERKRERFLSFVELKRLGKVLEEVERFASEHPSVIPALRLLIFSGARLNEVLSLRWEYYDEQNLCFRLPDSKSGEKTLFLNVGAIETLNRLKSNGNPWVLPGAKAGHHLVNLQKPWRSIRKKADFDDVRIHDLRHSFASVGAGAGLSLPLLGGLLGHKRDSTTSCYAHLADDPLRCATDEIGKLIEQAMNGGDNNEKTKT